MSGEASVATCCGLCQRQTVLKFCRYTNRFFLLGVTILIGHILWMDWDSRDDKDDEHSIAELLSDCDGRKNTLQECFEKLDHKKIQSYEDQGWNDTLKGWAGHGVTFGAGYASVIANALISKWGNFELDCTDMFLTKLLLPPFSCWSRKPWCGIPNRCGIPNKNTWCRYWFANPGALGDIVDDDTPEAGTPPADSEQSVDDDRSEGRRSPSSIRLETSYSVHDEVQDSVAFDVRPPSPSSPAPASPRFSRFNPNATEFVPGQARHH